MVLPLLMLHAAIIVTGQSSSSSDCPTVGEPNVNSSIGLSDDTIIAAYTVNIIIVYYARRQQNIT